MLFILSLASAATCFEEPTAKCLAELVAERAAAYPREARIMEAFEGRPIELKRKETFHSVKVLSLLGRRTEAEAAVQATRPHVATADGGSRPMEPFLGDSDVARAALWAAVGQGPVQTLEVARQIPTSPNWGTDSLEIAVTHLLDLGDPDAARTVAVKGQRHWTTHRPRTWDRQMMVLQVVRWRLFRGELAEAKALRADFGTPSLLDHAVSMRDQARVQERIDAVASLPSSEQNLAKLLLFEDAMNSGSIESVKAVVAAFRRSGGYARLVRALVSARQFDDARAVLDAENAIGCTELSRSLELAAVAGEQNTIRALLKEVSTTRSPATLGVALAARALP